MYRKAKPSGWTDNLDLELSHQRRASPERRGIAETSFTCDDHQPGPSGIDYSRVTTTVVDGVTILQERGKSTADSDSEDEDDNDSNPYAIFAEKVTVAGLPEAYNEPVTASRLMFRAALIVAFVAIAYEASQIGRQYQDPTTVIADVEMLQIQAPFPNITVCVPRILNGRRLKSFMRPFEKSINITMDEIVDFVRRTVSMQVGDRDRRGSTYIATKNMFDKALLSAAENGTDIYTEMFGITCSEFLSNCHFGEQQFDCCKDAESSSFNLGSCIQLGNYWSNSPSTGIADPMLLKNAGLSFLVSLDTEHSIFEDNILSSGFNVFIGSVATDVQVPAHVPSEMDVTIVLAEPRYLEEITKCRQQVRVMKYMDYFDPFGELCKYDVIRDMMINQLGCVEFSVAYSSPKNNATISCLFDQVFFMANAARNGGKQFENTYYLKRTDSDPMAMIIPTKLDNDTVNCYPLCSRWTYPVLSATYGSIQLKTGESHQSNRSWSRIRVLFPDSSRRRSEETKPTGFYLALCDIGGMMGVYAGFSMITFAQVFAYGIYIIWEETKKRRELVRTLVRF